jgi:hypothetical protein
MNNEQINKTAAQAAEIAGEMLAIVIHDSDLLDVAKDRVEHAKARLAERLEEPLRKEGAGLFTKELLENFCIGDVADVQAILAAHPSLKPAHDLLDEFFEEADAAGAAGARKRGKPRRPRTTGRSTGPATTSCRAAYSWRTTSSTPTSTSSGGRRSSTSTAPGTRTASPATRTAASATTTSARSRPARA